MTQSEIVDKTTYLLIFFQRYTQVMMLIFTFYFNYYYFYILPTPNPRNISNSFSQIFLSLSSYQVRAVPSTQVGILIHISTNSMYIHQVCNYVYSNIFKFSFLRSRVVLEYRLNNVGSLLHCSFGWLIFLLLLTHFDKHGT